MDQFLENDVHPYKEAIQITESVLLLEFIVPQKQQWTRFKNNRFSDGAFVTDTCTRSLKLQFSAMWH